MKQFFLPMIGAAAVLVGLSGCIDDKYDIDDANSLTRVPVNNLVVPLNLEKVYLDSIVDLTDRTNIEKYTDPVTGAEYYALTEKGSIDSEDVSIDPIHIGKAQIQSSTITLSTGTRSGAPAGSIAVPLVAKTEPFTYTANDVDSAVESIEIVQTQSKVKIVMTLTLPSSLQVSSAYAENLNLQFPSGLYMADGKTAAETNTGTYNPQNGILTVPAHTFASSHRTQFTVTCEKVTIPSGEQKPAANRALSFTGTMGIVEVNGYAGTLFLSMKPGQTLPSTFSLSADYDLPMFDVKNFTGTIDYQVENSSIEPISLDNLPDFLKDPQTNIILADPQFYFAIDNPTAPYGTVGKGHIEMISNFRNEENVDLKDPFVSNSPQFTINAAPKTNVALSPSGAIKNPLPAYAQGLEEYVYPQMSQLLSGATGSEAVGLPSTIEVSFADPRLTGHAVDFPVGVNIGKVSGTYEFFAPLAFDDTSVIVYQKSCEIGGDEMDDIYVKYLNVNADCDSSFPVDVKLTAYIYAKDGTLLGHSNAVNIPAMVKGEKIALTINPEHEGEVMNIIHHIDFRADIHQEGDEAGTALAPDQGLVLSTLRITVDGYFEKKL